MKHIHQFRKKYIASKAITKIQFIARIISCNEDGDEIVDISIKKETPPKIQFIERIISCNKDGDEIVEIYTIN